jgi:hypothetical protein
MEISSAPVAHVLDRECRPPHITGYLLATASEEPLPALFAALGPDFIVPQHRYLERERGLCPLLGRLLGVRLVGGHKLHDLMRRNPEVNKLLENEVVEDQPREVRAVEDSFILPERLVELLERAAAERAFAPDQLVEKNLFLAARTGRVRGLHA